MHSSFVGFGLSILIATVALFLLNDEVEIFQNSTVEAATIIGCASRTVTLGKKASARKSTQYASIAITDSGASVTGAYLHPEQHHCEKRVYRETKILLHNENDTLNRIYSFPDFWLMPAILGFWFITFLLTALRELSNNKIIRHAYLGWTLLFFVFLLGKYFVDYETARGFDALGIESEQRGE